jgi:hypothetical protein
LPFEVPPATMPTMVEVARDDQLADPTNSSTGLPASATG